MARENEFIAYVLELIAPLGAASSRSMFGGYGIYIDSQIIAIVIDDTLYFKTDDASRKQFDDLGLEPFSYTANGKTYAMSYFRAPDEALDSPHSMLPWARTALAAALRSAAAKKPRRKSTAAEAKPKPKALKNPKR
jgi:DNA transformation protein and related proteins